MVRDEEGNWVPERSVVRTFVMSSTSSLSSFRGADDEPPQQLQDGSGGDDSASSAAGASSLQGKYRSKASTKKREVTSTRRISSAASEEEGRIIAALLRGGEGALAALNNSSGNAASSASSTPVDVSDHRVEGSYSPEGSSYSPNSRTMIKSGWLGKRGEVNKAVRRRYFVLDSTGALTWFAKPPPAGLVLFGQEAGKEMLSSLWAHGKVSVVNAHAEAAELSETELCVTLGSSIKRPSIGAALTHLPGGAGGAGVDQPARLGMMMKRQSSGGPGGLGSGRLSRSLSAGGGSSPRLLGGSEPRVLWLAAESRAERDAWLEALSSHSRR